MGQNHSQIKKDKQKLIISPSIKQIKTQLCLNQSHVLQFYCYFNRIDTQKKGYIKLDDLIEQFNKYDQNFAQLPYLEHLFKIIQKCKQNVLFFQQFLKGVTVFCLMNSQSILQFIFNCIDEDEDNKISKDDIQKFFFYVNPKTGMQTFFTNFNRDIQKIKLKQNQTTLNFNQFRQNAQKIPFLIWPAYQLQDTFKKSILGIKEWQQIYIKAQKRQFQIKNNQKKELRIKEKLQALKLLIKKKEGPFYKHTLKHRKANQTGSDIKLQEDKQNSSKQSLRKSGIYLKPRFLIQLQNEQN